MLCTLAIPKRLKHLSLDERGLPVPHYLRNQSSPSDDAHYLKPNEVFGAFYTESCAFCGEGLKKRNFGFTIWGSPQNACRHISVDPPMHHLCALFAAKHRYPMVVSIVPDGYGHDKLLLMRPRRMVYVAVADSFRRVRPPDRLPFAFSLTRLVRTQAFEHGVDRFEMQSVA